MILLGRDSLDSKDIYKLVKCYCDQRFGIPSQCVKSDNIRRVPRGYEENILLKVNGKLGGRNKLVDVSNVSPKLKTDTMVVGMDVNHPGLGETLGASISSAVGTYDSNYSMFSACARVQSKDRGEMIHAADEMITELVDHYKVKNKKAPKNVFLFRDGVSEGQFDLVRQNEIPLIRKVLNQNQIKLTYIIVQKRHNTRFVLRNPEMAGKKMTWNVPAGTVVDKSIIEPDQDIFYLNSHFSPLVSFFNIFVRFSSFIICIFSRVRRNRANISF